MGTDSVIYLRTDGNRHISTGHLVRCAAIFQALNKLGRKVCFLVADEDSRFLLEGFLSSAEPIRVLDKARYDCLEEELPTLLPLLSSQEKRPLLLLDSYYATPEYLRAVRKVAAIAYIDDLRQWDYEVDLILNYDLMSSAVLSEYEAFYRSASNRLLGPAYTPLREQFADCHPVFRDSIRNVLLTSGGSDPEGFCLYFLTFILESLSKEQAPCPFPGDRITFHVVVGRLFSSQEKQALIQLGEKHNHLCIHEGLTNLAPLMKECDLALSAAGTTLYELCALGVPSISYTMADNQLDCAIAFKKAGVIPYAGDLRREGLLAVSEKIRTFLEQMYLLPGKREAAQDTMHRLIDGKGAHRIAEALCRL